MSEDIQLTNFLKNVPNTHVAEDPNAPQVVFESGLKLTRKQEDDFLAWSLEWKDRMELDMGRDEKAFWGSELTDIECLKFFQKRRLWDAVYRQRMEWRRYAGNAPLFQQHNMHFPMIRRIVQQQIAKANDSLYGTTPFMSVSPVGSEDTTLAEDINGFVKYRQELADYEKVARKATGNAFIFGEGISKTHYDIDQSTYEETAVVLVDESGEALAANDGDYIYESDGWIPDPDMPGDPTAMVLKRDPTTAKPEVLTYVEMNVSKQETRFKGVKTSNVYFLDFLCPPDAASVEDAECVIHLVERNRMALAQLYLQQEGGEDKLGSGLARLAKFLRNSSGPNDDIGGPMIHKNESRGELNDEGSQEKADRVNFAEVYARYDVFADGNPRNLFMIVDLKQGVPVYYQYLEKMTPQGRRPFAVKVVDKEEGRWYGSGTVEEFYPLQLQADIILNRALKSQSESDGVIFWDPSCVTATAGVTTAGGEGKNLEVASGQTYKLVAGKTKEQALGVVYLTDIKSDELRKQLELIMQMMTNMSGVANANDAQAAGLDTADLATGVRNIENSGDVMFSQYMSELVPGARADVTNFVLFTLHYMDEEEVYHFYNGDVAMLGKITQERTRDIRLDITIDLNRQKNKQDEQSNSMAMQLAVEYYAMPMWMQERLRGLAISRMKAFEIKDAEEYLIPTDPSDPYGQVAAAAAAGVAPMVDEMGQPMLMQEAAPAAPMMPQPEPVA